MCGLLRLPAKQAEEEPVEEENQMMETGGGGEAHWASRTRSTAIGEQEQGRVQVAFRSDADATEHEWPRWRPQPPSRGIPPSQPPSETLRAGWGMAFPCDLQCVQYDSTVFSTATTISLMHGNGH